MFFTSAKVAKQARICGTLRYMCREGKPFNSIGFALCVMFVYVYVCVCSCDRERDLRTLSSHTPLHNGQASALHWVQKRLGGS